RERSVDDVAVAGDPADVGRAPVDIGVGFDVEHEAVRRGDAGQVAAAGVHDALRFRRGAGRVEQVEHLLGVERLCRAVARGLLDLLVPPDVAAGGPGDVAARPPHDYHVLDRGAFAEDAVD